MYERAFAWRGIAFWLIESMRYPNRDCWSCRVFDWDLDCIGDGECGLRRDTPICDALDN